MTPFTPRPMSEHELGQLKLQVVLLSAKADLQERELQAFKIRCERERQMFGWLAESLLDPAQNRETLKQWVKAHVEHCECQVEIRVVAIAELRRDKNVLEAMIREGEKPQLIAPGKGLGIV